MKLENFKLEYNPAETKEFGVTDYMLDAISGVPAGLEDMAHGVYNLGDFLSFDVLPDWDEERFFKRPQTLAGDLTAGIVQYALPFGVIGKGLSKAGKLAKGVKPGKLLDLKPQGYLATDVATNFVAFDGQQERLSNLLKEVDNPALNNAVTQYLAADPDDSELEGRMKNVLEGVMIDAGVGALFKVFSSGLKASKRYTKELNGGASKEDAVVSASLEYQDQIKGVNAFESVAELPSFTDDITILQKELDEDKVRLDELLKKQEAGETTGVEDSSIAMLQRRIEGKEADIRVLSGLRTADVKERVKTAELRERVEEVDELVPPDVGDLWKYLEEAESNRPPPYQSYEDAGMLDVIPRGAKDIIQRLRRPDVLKAVDPDDVKDVEKFIDVIGTRLFSDVAQPMITNKIPAAGQFEFGSNLLKIRKSVLEEGSLKRVMVHELWHSLSRYLPTGDLDRLTKQFNRERNKYIQSFGIDVADLDNPFDVATVQVKDIPSELKKFLRGKRGDFNSKNYRFKDIDEYFAEEMTDAWFKKMGEGDLAPTGTFKRVAQDIAILFKDMFESLKAKLGIDQRQKIFNDFLKQRNIKTQRQTSLRGLEATTELPQFKDTVSKLVKQTDATSFKIGGKVAVKGPVKDLAKLTEGLNTSELAALQDQVADKLLKDGVKMQKLSKELLEEGAAMEMADLMGVDGRTMQELIDQASQDSTTLFRITSRMAALKELMEANGQEILNVARNYKDTFNKMSLDEMEMTEARLKGLIEQQLHIQAGHSSLASGFGRGLKSRQIGTKLGLSPDELQNTELRQEFLSKKGGMSMDQMVEGILIAEKNGGDDLFATLIGVNKQIRGANGGKLTDMVQEYYKNSLMWGPRTLTINALGTGLSNVWKNFERSIGGWMSADPAVRRAASNQWGEAMSLMDIKKFLLNAWETGDQFIGDAGSAFVENSKSSIGSINARNVQEVMRGVEMSDGVKDAIDWFGNTIRIPNRFNTSVDQLYKFHQYKSRALAELKLKAYDLGMRDPKEVSTYIHDAFEALVTRSNRNFSEGALLKEANEVVQGPFQTPADRQRAVADYVQAEKSDKLNRAREAGLINEKLDDHRALEELTKNWIDPSIKTAEEVTFSSELGPFGQAVQNLVTKSKVGFLVAPFVRTPTNILKFSYDRISAPARAAIDLARASEGWSKLEPGYRQRIEALKGGLKGSEEYRKTLLEQLNAVKADGTPDRIARAEARGKIAFGTVLNASLFYAVNNFSDNITGGGPKDYKQRQAWLASGKLPYSIKVGDTWVSYQRLDPLATVIGIYADAKELSNDNKLTSANSDDLDKLMGITFELGIRNVTDKSYLAGVNKFIKTLSGEGTPGKYFGGIAGGFLPNIIPQGASITGDQHMKEARGFADVILKRIPGTDVDLKRNPLGEPVVQQYFEGVAGVLNPLNPLAWGFDKDDKVAKELANVAHGFSAPSTKLEGVIELTEFIGSNGRSAYDRMLDLQSKLVLNGMTQRQALSKLIKDKRYQALDPKSFVGLPSERVKYINRILSRYKKAARMQMLREFPEIMQMQQEVKSATISGVPREDVLELLTQ